MHSCAISNADKEQRSSLHISELLHRYQRRGRTFEKESNCLLSASIAENSK